MRRLSSDRVRRQNAKRDVLMLGLCAFALVGGVFIVRGFAARDVDTLSPGIVSADKLRIEGDGQLTNFNLDISSNHQYCFIADPLTQTARMSIYARTVLQETFVVAPGQQEICYIPSSEKIENVDVVVDSGLSLINLRITQL